MTRLDRSTTFLVSTLSLGMIVVLLSLSLAAAQEPARPGADADRRVLKGQTRELLRMLGSEQAVNLVLPPDMPELARVVEVDVTGLTTEAALRKVATAAGMHIDTSDGILRITLSPEAGGRSALAWRLLEAPRAFDHSDTKVGAMNVTNQLLMDVVADIEAQAGVSVLVDAPLREARVTISLAQPVAWREVVGILADRCRAEVQDIAGNVVRLYLKPRTALEFRDAPIKDAIRTIARVSGLNLIIPSNLPEVDNLITLNVRNVTWDDALDSILKSANLVAFRDPGGIIRIASQRDPAWRRLFGSEPEDEAAAPPEPLAKERRALEAVAANLTRLEEAAAADELVASAALVEQIRQLLDGLQAVEDEALRARYQEARSAYDRATSTLRSRGKAVTAWISASAQTIHDRFRTAEKSDRSSDFRRVVEADAELHSVASAYLGGELAADALATLQESAALAARASAHLEFKQLPLRVAGVSFLANPALRDHSRAVVFYDDVSRELDAVEWPYIEENRDLRLYEITEDGVIFQYKGEQIHKAVEEESEVPRRSGGGRRGPGRRR